MAKNRQEADRNMGGEENTPLDYKEIFLIFTDALTNLITIAQKLDQKIQADDKNTESFIREFDRIASNIRDLAENNDMKLEKMGDIVSGVKDTINDLETAVSLLSQATSTSKSELTGRLNGVQRELISKIDGLVKLAFDDNKSLLKQVLKQSDSAVKSYTKGMDKWQGTISLVLKIAGLIVLSAMGVKIGADMILKVFGS